jgi:hypothetical protein
VAIGVGWSMKSGALHIWNETFSGSVFGPTDWAAVWIPFGDRYMAQAKSLESAHNPSAKDMYLRAYTYYKVAHYPTDNSPKKKEAYQKGIDAIVQSAS